GIFTSASPADDKDTQPMTSAELDQVVVRPFERTQWSGAAAPGVGDDVAAALEGGDVGFLPRLRFEPSDAELALFSPGIVGASKNVGFDPTTRRLGGTVLAGAARDPLAGMLARFSDAADALVRQMLPSYASRIARGRTSFRPVEIEGRKT